MLAVYLLVSYVHVGGLEGPHPKIMKKADYTVSLNVADLDGCASTGTLLYPPASRDCDGTKFS